MSSLTGTKIKDTYDGLLKTTDNGALGASAKQITDGLGNSSGVYLGTSGNVGIGVSPNAKLSLAGGSDINSQNPILYINSNSYYSGGEKYVTTGAVARYAQINGEHIWSNAASGTAGAAISFSERMRIDSSGNVEIGTASATSSSKVTIQAQGVNGSDETALVLRNYSATPFTGYVTTEFEVGTALMAEISAYRLNSTNGELIFRTKQSGTITESMRIDSSGNVGIGTNSNSYTSAGRGNLNIAGSGGAILGFQIGGSAMGYVYHDNTNLQLWNEAAGNLLFATNSTERMRITSGGSLLIGKIAESNAPAGLWLQKDASDGGQIRFGRQSGTATQTHLYFFNSGGGSVGSVTTTDSSTAYNTSSDYRLKEDLQPMTNSLDRISSLKPVNFAWKSDGKRVDGFLAHELQEVIPEAVTGTKDAMRDEEYEVSPAIYEDVVHPAEEAVYETIEHPAIAEELDADGNIIVEAQEAWTEQVLVSEAKEEWTERVLVSEAVMGTRSVPDYQGIDQSKIVPLLVAAIQELKAEVDALKGA